MSMYTAIIDTVKQFDFEPVVKNGKDLKENEGFVVVGMGGSHLAADLLKIIRPKLDVIVHKDYGLPSINLQKRLIILSCYSGNTEEVLDAYDKAGSIGLKRAVVTIGGKLLEKAKQDNVPYIQMPDLGIPPRMALALNLKSLYKFLGENLTLSDFHPGDFEKEGKKLADMLRGYVPVIYASAKNEPLAYNWKVKFNETGKIPAFYNVIPEANHNEMNGFDVKDSTRDLSKNFYFIFLTDSQDHLQIQKRMEITEKLYRDRKLPTIFIQLSGNDTMHKIFNFLALADFTAYFTAENYSLEPEQTPMIEEFKKML